MDLVPLSGLWNGRESPCPEPGPERTIGLPCRLPRGIPISASALNASVSRVKVGRYVEHGSIALKNILFACFSREVAGSSNRLDDD